MAAEPTTAKSKNGTEPKRSVVPVADPSVKATPGGTTRPVVEISTGPSSRRRRKEARSASLDDLIQAFRESGRPDYDRMKRVYQQEHGSIRETYFAKRIHAGALIVKPGGVVARLSQKRRIYLRYDGLAAAAVQPEFEAAIWRARAMERQSGLILGGRSRKVLVEMLFSILVYLLGVLDATVPTERSFEEGRRNDRRKRIESALQSAKAELDRLDKFTKDAARKASLRWYLVGLPVGAIVVMFLIGAADAWSSLLMGSPSQVMQVCFACGAIGGIVSVMARITRGQRLDIDSEQGHLVTLLAGGFRPLIGAIFGAALYVFVEGGLVPIAVPSEKSSELLFFASLAFLSGFSERWAQDTIVQSTPALTKPRAGLTSGEGREDTAQAPTRTPHPTTEQA